MADVFLFHARGDEARAEALAIALRQNGWTLRVSDNADVEMFTAECVVALLSHESLSSFLLGPVIQGARERGVLVPVKLDDADLPSDISDIWYADLSRWPDRLESSGAFLALQRAVKKLVQAETGADKAEKTGPTRRAAADSGRALQQHRSRERKPSTAKARFGILFICYRREDTQDAAGRLHDRLIDAYGSERVFMDIDSVPLGIDFVDLVTEQISRCSAVIVMIGKQWLTIKDKKRRRRLDNDGDLVRAEIAAALRQNIPVIPVVVQNASMPTVEDLPEDIRLLGRRNGIQLRPEQWREGVERLLKELNPIMGVKQ